jgi:hypothetical protein
MNHGDLIGRGVEAAFDKTLASEEGLVTMSQSSATSLEVPHA